jgi:D-alanyl-D-alanine carboxypeptidase
MADRLIDSVVPELSDRVRQVMAAQGVPGVAVGIVRDQELAWSGGFGYADVASARPMTDGTLFGVASITKTFTATAIMQLRDEGKLSLEDPVVRHLPEFRAVRSRFCAPQDVTVRMLMTHLSGLVGESPTGHWSSLQFPTMDEVIATLGRVELVIEPLSAFKYCNLAFALLGEIVARASGRPYIDYVASEILEPLGMADSGFTIESASPRVRSATGHHSARYGDVAEVSPDPPTNGYAAAAGLRSSVADLAKWISLQFRTQAEKRSGAQVLTGRSLSAMHRVVFVEPDWRAGYALTWMAFRPIENIYLGHGGSVPGFLSMIAFSKPLKLGVIALTNKQGHVAAGTICFQALEMLAAQAAKFPAPPPVPIATPENFKPLLGRYAGSATFGTILHVEYRSGALTLVVPPDPFMIPAPPAPLATTHKPDTFIVTAGRAAGEPLRFEFAADGKVAGFMMGENGTHFRKTD